jgi:tRNA threonylcarbamoyladenosine biosynthesis protein TsaB
MPGAAPPLAVDARPLNEYNAGVKIMALDTSTEHCSAALWLDGELTSLERHAGQTHSEILLPMIDRLLGEAEMSLGRLDGIAFGAGPGSFTGLRIGCGVAQGLAFGAGLPVLGIGTLLALAQAGGAHAGGLALCCMDARMGEIYHAAYRRSTVGWEVVEAPGLCKPALAPVPVEGEWNGYGNAFAVYGDVLRSRYGERLASVDAAQSPHASDIAVLAVPLFERGLGAAAEHAAPHYIRDKVALRTDER